MSTRILNDADAPETSAVVTPVTALRSDRVVFLHLSGDADVQVEVSPDGSEWFPFEAQITTTGLYTKRVPAQVYLRVDVTDVIGGEVNAWVA